MRHVHLPLEDVLKQEDGIDRLASMFLEREAVRPDPRWYADLLEEHEAEIAAAILLWFLEVQDALGSLDWVEWTDPFLWAALEERLAVLLAPKLREAARAAARRQAVEEGEPIPLRLADMEIAAWAGSEAVRQARLIADETRVAVIESMIALSDAGMANQDTFHTLLAAGLFSLTRRFAGAALRPILYEGAYGIGAAVGRAQRLLEVRQRMIRETNTVAAIMQGIMITASFWERDGKVVTKTYMTQADERVCPRCGPLHGQEIPLRGLFMGPNGEVVESPPVHPLCRCFVRVAMRPADSLGMFL